MKHLYSIVFVLVALTYSHLATAQIIPNVTTTNDNTFSCSGTASAAPTGGAGGYSFMWSTGETTSSISNLCAGAYSVMIMDAIQDSAYYSFTITNPCSNLVLSASVTNVTGPGNCDGAIQTTVTGGTGPYTFSISGGGQGGQSLFSNLCAGTYTVTVADANGCTAVATATVTDPCAGFSAIAVSSPDINGNCNGSATGIASGGTSPYYYSWDNGASFGPSPTLSNQCGGITWDFYCIDANGCWSNGQSITIGDSTITNNILANLDFLGDLTGNCDGSAFVSPTGGTPPYSYLWSNGATTNFVNNLCVGNHSVTIWDNTDTITTTFTITNPCTNFTGTISSTPTSGPAACDGTASFTPSGGTAPYNYYWDNGISAQSISNLCAANYSIMCEDSNGCMITQSLTISDSIVTISNLSANLTSTDDLTNNCSGSASIVISGGITPYTVLWSNGQVGGSISNLCAGIYSVTVWDAVNDSTTIDFIIADSSSTYNNNPYPNGSINDTLYTDLVTNCIINYTAIDSASLYQAVYSSSTQSLYVTWAVYSPTDTVYISDTLALIGNPGYYNLTISVYCPNKSGNDFFKIEQVIYFDGSQVWMSTLNVTENALDNISIYPNPFTHSISVDNKDGVIQSMKLVDLNGRVLSEMPSMNSGIVKLDQLENLSSGTYFMVLSGSNVSKTVKVIK